MAVHGLVSKIRSAQSLEALDPSPELHLNPAAVPELSGEGTFSPNRGQSISKRLSRAFWSSTSVTNHGL